MRRGKNWEEEKKIMQIELLPHFYYNLNNNFWWCANSILMVYPVLHLIYNAHPSTQLEYLWVKRTIFSILFVIYLSYFHFIFISCFGAGTLLSVYYYCVCVNKYDAIWMDVK